LLLAPIGRQGVLQVGDRIAAGNDALTDKHPAQPPHPKGKAAPSPEQFGGARPALLAGARLTDS